MEPSTLPGYAQTIQPEPEASSLLGCPCCGALLTEQGGLLRCRLCQFSFCQTCGDELPE
jgi:hypothetical protein